MAGMTELDGLSLQVLRELCMDCRESVLAIAKKVGKAPLTVASRIEMLEEEKGLHYVPELDERRMGLVSYLIAVRMGGKIPGEKLREELGKSHIPQFAAMCKGDFDLLIYATAFSQLEFLQWERRMRAMWPDEIEEWKAATVVFPRLGFFSLRPAVAARLPLPSPRKEILVELLYNARMPLNKLARRVNITANNLRYHLRQILSDELIERFTALIQKPSMAVHSVYFSHYKLYPDHEGRGRRNVDRILGEEGVGEFNRCVMEMELSGFADTFTWCVFRDEKDGYVWLKESEEILGGSERGKIESATLVERILGDLPLRSIELAKVYERGAWGEKLSLIMGILGPIQRLPGPITQICDCGVCIGALRAG